jgi:hypothetical protein
MLPIATLNMDILQHLGTFLSKHHLHLIAQTCQTLLHAAKLAHIIQETELKARVGMQVGYTQFRNEPPNSWGNHVLDAYGRHQDYIWEGGLYFIKGATFPSVYRNNKIYPLWFLDSNDMADYVELAQDGRTIVISKNQFIVFNYETEVSEWIGYAPFPPRMHLMYQNIVLHKGVFYSFSHTFVYILGETGWKEYHFMVPEYPPKCSGVMTIQAPEGVYVFVCDKDSNMVDVLLYDVETRTYERVSVTGAGPRDVFDMFECEGVMGASGYPTFFPSFPLNYSTIWTLVTTQIHGVWHARWQCLKFPREVYNVLRNSVKTMRKDWCFMKEKEDLLLIHQGKGVYRMQLYIA